MARSLRITIICGSRDSGKTRACAALAARYRARGLRVGGILSEAEMLGGVKTRYSFVEVETGARAPYAVRRQEPIPHGLLAYEFLDDGLAFGCAAIRRAASDRVDALFVDEIGPLEIGGGGLWEPVREILASYEGRLYLAVRSGLLETLREKIGAATGEVASEAAVLSPGMVDAAARPRTSP